MLDDIRKDVLLVAAYEILRKCGEGPFVRNALEVTANWDGTDCDGYTLIADIADLLSLPYADECYVYKKEGL